MKSKINYYILIPKGEWERFHERLNKAVAAMSMNVEELGDAFGKVAKILRDDKFYKAVCEVNKYIEKNNKLMEN